MNSNLFDSLGLNIDAGILFIIMFVFIIGLLISLVVLTGKYNKLNVSYQLFMKGREAESLEEEIMALFQDIDTLKMSNDKNRRDIKKMIENLRECYQRVGIVKYDAFSEMGGKLSFSIAILDDNANGLIINSVHSSDGCYVYTKEISGGECAISLGEEEKKALILALQDEPYIYD